MKNLISLSLFSLALAQDYPEVSRLGKNIRLLIQVTAPGASTPETLFNKTKNPAEEPKLTNYLSPLGQRQQFLVGSEYRLRYVDEQQGSFLNSSYDISQIWIQSTFDQKTILSAQAQLIGLYPPQSYNNFLNQWQQGNAVPPLNNTDNSTWAHWQAELGSLAVLDGFNVFPINMIGANQDYLLNLGPKNCPTFNKSLTEVGGIDFDKHADFLVRLSALFNLPQFNLPAGYAACQYLLWADLHSVELTLNYTQDDLSHCNQIMNDAANVYVSNNFKLQDLASAEFLQKVHDYVKTAIGSQQYHQSLHFKELTARNEKNERLYADGMNANNANSPPYYVFYSTNDINLQMFVASLVGKDVWKQTPKLQNHIVPASSLVLEIVETDGKFYVEVYLNDEQIPLQACAGLNPCQAKLLTQFLEDNIQYKNETEVNAACNPQPSKEFVLEDAINQDKEKNVLTNPAFQNQPQNSNKPALFGPSPNLNGIQPSFPQAQPQQTDLTGKSKRDLLWEQKRKNKQDIINPPIMRDGAQAQPSSIVDSMAPIPPKLSSDFKKATVFEQPQTLMEIQPSHPAVSTPQQQQMYQQPMQNYLHNPPQLPPPQQMEMKPFSQPRIPEPQMNMWDQIQQMHPQQQFPSQFEQQVIPNQQQFIRQEPVQEQQQFRQYIPDLGPPPQMQQYEMMQQPYQEQQPQQYQPPSSSNQGQPVVVNKKITKIGNEVSEDQKRKQQAYLNNLQQEIKEKEEKKKREKEERIRKEQEELKKNMEYNPFGRAGAGAPIKDMKGNVVVNRKQGVELSNQQQNQMAVQQPIYNQQQSHDQFQYNPPMNQQQMMPQYQQQPPQFQQQQFQMPQMPMMMEMFNQPPPVQQQQFQQQPLQIQQQDYFQQPPQFQQQITQLSNEAQMFSPPQMHNQKQQQANAINQSVEIPSNNQRGNGLSIGVYNEGEGVRQKEQKKELKNVLKQQMEEQKRRKEEEVRKKKEEELREEQRIMKERMQIEEEFKREEQKKKAKFNEIQEANAQIIQSKNKGKREPIDLGDGPNFLVEKKGANQNQFQPPQINQSFEQYHKRPELETPQPSQHQSNPQISQTRIINDISNELKNNFREEISKLRNEMSSQQRVFREQLERLKIESNTAQQQKQEAMSEVEKIKHEIKMQREQQRIEDQKIFSALEKHNPNKPIDPLDMLNNYDKPGAVYQNKQQPIIPTYQSIPAQNSFQRPGGSRQESRDNQRKREINNYEKMFFGQGPVKSLQDQQKKETPNYGLKEEKIVNLNEYNPYQQHQPKVIQRSQSNYNNQSFKMSGTLKGESTLLPMNADPAEEILKLGYNPYKYDTVNPTYENVQPYQHKQEYNKENNKNISNHREMGRGQQASYQDQFQQIAPNTHRVDTSTENTMDFVNRIVNNKDESIIKPSHHEARMADKLDAFDFNFPSLPAYEGFQKDLYLNQENSKHSSNNNQQFEPYPKKNYSLNNDLNPGLITGEHTQNSFGTLNSVNLEKVNKRNEDRMAKFGISLDSSPPIDQRGNQQIKNQGNFQQNSRDTNEELKQLDNLLFDILRDNSSPGKEYKYGDQGNRINHLNSNNNAENMARMRETRDQFIAPKLGSINEDKLEDYEGTFKAYKNEGYRIEGNMGRYDSLLDGTNLGLD